MIYTIYAKENDMTFIMEKEIVEQKEYLSVVGFYFGEPNEADTKEYMNSLTAEFEVENPLNLMARRSIASQYNL